MKELFILIGIVIYIGYYSIKNWGRKYKFVGLDERRKILYKSVPKEEKCRVVFEKIFNSSFKKCRPDFLKNPCTGRNLELDGFNKSIISPIGRGLAFEFNGSQHYFYQPRYHKDFNDYEYQLKKDEIKKGLCKKNGIVLITIPWDIKEENLESFIIKKLYENGLYYYLN